MRGEIHAPREPEQDEHPEGKTECSAAAKAENKAQQEVRRKEQAQRCVDQPERPEAELSRLTSICPAGIERRLRSQAVGGVRHLVGTHPDHHLLVLPARCSNGEQRPGMPLSHPTDRDLIYVGPDRHQSMIQRLTLGEPTRRRQDISEPTRPTTYGHPEPEPDVTGPHIQGGDSKQPPLRTPGTAETIHPPQELFIVQVHARFDSVGTVRREEFEWHEARFSNTAEKCP